MELKPFLFFGFVNWLALLVLKVIFFGYLDPGTLLTRLLFGLAAVVVSTAAVRRLGYINYLESLLAAGVWFFFALILDFLVLSPIVGEFSVLKGEVWASYLMLTLTVFLFHKKRHIKIRKEMAAHH